MTGRISDDRWGHGVRLIGERVGALGRQPGLGLRGRSPAPSETASGLARNRLIGPDQGAVHTELAAVGIQPGGWLAPHVHSFEESLYVLEGELLLQLGERVHRLVAADYALIPTGLRHGLGNGGDAPVRLLSLNSPQRLDPAGGRKDTFFEPPRDLAEMDAAATRPPFGDPTLRLVGHYEGTGPQLEALAVTDPARGRAPAGATPRSWRTAASR